MLCVGVTVSVSSREAPGVGSLLRGRCWECLVGEAPSCPWLGLADLPWAIPLPPRFLQIPPKPPVLLRVPPKAEFDLHTEDRDPRPGLDHLQGAQEPVQWVHRARGDLGPTDALAP